MKKLTLLVDMDDVLKNLVECWTSVLNQRYGTSVREEDVTSWYIADFFPFLTKEQIFGVLHEHGFWESLSPMQNAPEVLERLISDGHTVRVVTASHYLTVPHKINRLLTLYPCLSWEDVIVASDKRCIMGDVMIDDGVHNLELTACRKLLFDRPHNRSFHEQEHGMVRVHSWNEIYAEITKIAGGTK